MKGFDVRRGTTYTHLAVLKSINLDSSVSFDLELSAQYAPQPSQGVSVMFVCTFSQWSFRYYSGQERQETASWQRRASEGAYRRSRARPVAFLATVDELVVNVESAGIDMFLCPENLELVVSIRP